MLLLFLAVILVAQSVESVEIVSKTFLNLHFYVKKGYIVWRNNPLDYQHLLHMCFISGLYLRRSIIQTSRVG